MLALLITFVALIALQRGLKLPLSRRDERALRAKGAYERGPLPGHRLPARWVVGLHAPGGLGAGGTAFDPVAVLASPVHRRAGAALLGHPEPRRALDNAPHHPARVPLVKRGPYKHAQHPNYLAVALEIYSAPLIFGASFTALVFTLLNLGVLLLRIRTEARGLREVNRPC